MKELQELAEQLQRENFHLRTQVEQRYDLHERDAQGSGRARHPAICDKGKKPIALDDVDTSADDGPSSCNSPNPSLVRRKNNKDRTHQRHSLRPAFNDSNGGILRRATSRGHNSPIQAPGNAFVLPTGLIPLQLVYPALETRPALYMPPTTTI